MSQGPALHFLHTESRASLGLVDQQGNRKKQITAEVVDKEYCQVKLNHLTLPAMTQHML